MPAANFVGLNTKGVKPLVTQLKAIGGATTTQDCAKLFGDVARALMRKVSANMASAGWPEEVRKNTFVDDRWPQSLRSKGDGSIGSVLSGSRSRVAVLAGIGKRGSKRPWRPGYVEWTALPYGKNAGKLVGESLSTMFEKGTSKMSPRPAWTPAVKGFRSEAREMVKIGLKKLIEQASKQTHQIVPMGDNNG